MTMEEVASCPAVSFSSSCSPLFRFFMGGGAGSWSLFSADELSGSRMLGTIREAMVASRKSWASCNLKESSPMLN